MRPTPVGWPFYVLVDGVIPPTPEVDADAILTKQVMVPEVTSDAFRPASGGLFDPRLPPGIGARIDLITKVNSEPFQGAAPGQAQYLGFDVDEVGRPGEFAWHDHFRYGENGIALRDGETLHIKLDQDFFWFWELETRSDPANGIYPGRKPYGPGPFVTTLYERADLNTILGT